MTIEAVRIADDEIYYDISAPKQPKEIFARAAEIIREGMPSSAQTLLDVGCASGEFIQYLSATTPALHCTGFDVSKKLIELAKKRCPTSSFEVFDLESQDCEKAFDVITMFGVMDCLDDGVSALAKLVQWTKPKGILVFLDFINNDPIDVITRYRRADVDSKLWEKGWNIYSRHTLDRFLGSRPTVANWRYQKFQISFDMPKRSDPMRTWTTFIDQNPRQLVNGACQIVNLEFVIVTMK